MQDAIVSFPTLNKVFRIGLLRLARNESQHENDRCTGLPVADRWFEVTPAGVGPSFDRSRMLQIASDYLRERGL